MSLNPYRLELYAGSAQPAVPVCELKFQVSVDDDYFNDMLESFGDAAQEYVESITGKVLGLKTFDLFLDSFPQAGFEFSNGPVNSITSIEYLVNGVYTTVPTSVYALGRGRSVRQSIGLKTGQTWPSLVDVQSDAVKIRYVAGEENKRGKQAIKMIVAHWFANREAVNIGNITSEIPIGAMALVQSLKTFKV